MTASKLRAALLLALALTVPLAPRAQLLPSLGGVDEMNTGAERKLGERIARELYRDPDYIDDPVVVEYVQKIWQPLLAAARARGELTGELDERFAWQVLLGKDRSINAFALPGGWLGLHMGLVSVTATRDELASVLAHELSHVTQRHISRLMAKDDRQAPLVLAAMILGALAAGRNPQAGSAVMAGGTALAQATQLNFSREMEREADRVGYGVMTQAGFDPQGFVSMFDKLQQAARLNDSGAFPYLRTHPLTTERIAEMQSRQQLATPAGPLLPTLEHAMVAGRARVIANSGVDALRATSGEPDAANFVALPRARQAGVLYAATLAASRLHDTPRATRLLARLASLTSADATAARLTTLLGAELALAIGDGARVLAQLSPGATGRPELLLIAQARLQAGHPGEAAPPLQTWVATHPRDATTWQLLARAYAGEGQTLRSIRADAEAQVAQLDFQAALDRLKAAQDLMRKGAGGGDHIEASIIDSRARQVESLLREQALER